MSGGRLFDVTPFLDQDEGQHFDRKSLLEGPARIRKRDDLESGSSQALRRRTLGPDRQGFRSDRQGLQGDRRESATDWLTLRLKILDAAADAACQIASAIWLKGSVHVDSGTTTCVQAAPGLTRG